ncbi:hypothetical protein Hanom_Chr12g01124911 [Helianthus anomalus]
MKPPFCTLSSPPLFLSLSLTRSTPAHPPLFLCLSHSFTLDVERESEEREGGSKKRERGWRRWRCSGGGGVAAPAEEEDGGVEGDCSLFFSTFAIEQRKRTVGLVAHMLKVRWVLVLKKFGFLFCLKIEFFFCLNFGFSLVYRLQKGNGFYKFTSLKLNMFRHAVVFVFELHVFHMMILCLLVPFDGWKAGVVYKIVVEVVVVRYFLAFVLDFLGGDDAKKKKKKN